MRSWTRTSLSFLGKNLIWQFLGKNLEWVSWARTSIEVNTSMRFLGKDLNEVLFQFFCKGNTCGIPRRNQLLHQKSSKSNVDSNVSPEASWPGRRQQLYYPPLKELKIIYVWKHHWKDESHTLNKSDTYHYNPVKQSPTTTPKPRGTNADMSLLLARKQACLTGTRTNERRSDRDEWLYKWWYIII